LTQTFFFAASNPASPTGRLIERLIAGTATLTCDYALEEARRNVERKWPGRAGNLTNLMSSIEVVPTVRFALSVTLADKDLPILCSAKTLVHYGICAQTPLPYGPSGFQVIK